MRKRRLSIGLLSMMMAACMTFGGNATDASAATKKLTVNRVYENATKITGKTQKKNKVTIKIGKETYKAKANKKGKFTIKIPKANVGKKYTLKSYKGKKLYKKKTVYVIAKKLKINKYDPNSKSISGYTRPSYKVKVKIGSKTYTKKANINSGYWKVSPGKKVGTTISVKVINTKGKVVTEEKKHVHDFKPVYKTVKHEEKGHWETVTVPAWDEYSGYNHDICLKDGRDLTQEFIDSIYNKTYPDYDDSTKENWGYTKENGWPRSSSDYAIYKEMGVNANDMKEVPPYDLYMGLQGWNGECDGHNYSLKPYYIHHEDTTKQEWKVDQKAYTEKIITGYKCSCGTEK